MTVGDTSSSLRSLLLFQSLAVYGTNEDSFQKTSDALRQCKLLGPPYHDDEEARLYPDALQQTYRDTLKAQTRNDSVSNSEHSMAASTQRSAPPAGASTGSSSVEASDSSMLIGAVARLYSDYRDKVVAEVQDHERRYYDLITELRALQNEDSETQTYPDDTTSFRAASRDASPSSKQNHTLSSDGRRLSPRNELEEPNKARSTRRSPHASIDAVVNDRSDGKAQPSTSQDQDSPVPSRNQPHSRSLSNTNTQLRASGPDAHTASATTTSILGDAQSKATPSLQSQHRDVGSPRPSSTPVAEDGSGLQGSTNASRPTGATASNAATQRGQTSSPQPPPRGGFLMPQFSVSRTGQQTTGPTTPQEPQVPARATPTRSHPGPLPNGAIAASQMGVAGRLSGRTPGSDPRQRLGEDFVTIRSPGSLTQWRVPANEADRLVELPRPPLSPTSTRHPMTFAGGDSPSVEHGKVGRPALRKKQQQSDASVSTPNEEHPIKSGSPTRSKGAARTIKDEPVGDETDATDTRSDGAVAEGRNKRKRSGGDDEDDNSTDVQVRELPKAPDTVVATKNFARIAATVFDTISSHKYASLFAHPVKERDAEGYSSIIKRPQDLKSMRAAIAAGGRAVTAATATDGGQTSPGPASTHGLVVLPLSDALIPPKGIVNPAQLEQEVMRMFANAVMFNPGDEEVVEDTREMYESVERALTAWRATQDTGADEADESAADSPDHIAEEGETPVTSKRRRF